MIWSHLILTLNGFKCNKVWRSFCLLWRRNLKRTKRVFESIEITDKRYRFKIIKSVCTIIVFWHSVGLSKISAKSKINFILMQILSIQNAAKLNSSFRSNKKRFKCMNSKNVHICLIVVYKITFLVMDDFHSFFYVNLKVKHAF